MKPAIQQCVDLILILPDFDLGGSQRVMSVLIDAWLQQGKRIVLMTLSDGREDYKQLPEAVIRISLSQQSDSQHWWQALFANLRRVQQLRRAIKLFQCATVISFLRSTNILTLFSTLGLKKNVVISERADPSKEKLGITWSLLLKLTYRFADAVVINNSGILNWLSHCVPSHKLHMIPNPIAKPIKSEKSDYFSILTVAQLRYEKGIDLLIQAFMQFHQVNPNWKLEIVGDGPEAEHLQAMASQCRAIIFHGRQQNVSSFYQQASIFVMPSRHEGMPNALLEAMSYGLAVVVGDASPGPLEYVKHGETGMVFQSENIAVLSKMLFELAGNASLREQLGYAAAKCLAPNQLDQVITSWNQLAFSRDEY